MKSRSAFFAMVGRGLNVWVLLLAVVVGLCVGGVLVPARADDVDDVLKNCTAATAEELPQIPFHAEVVLSSSSRGFSYELHNPFRTKTIEGIIIRVEFKDPKVADKEVVLEVFVRDHCAALQSSSGSEYFYRAEEAGRGPVTLTLKEVFFRKEAE